MTSTANPVDATSAAPGTVDVGILRLPTPTPEALQAALTDRAEPAGTWHCHLVGATSPWPVEIALCDAAGARTARTAWPSATVVALVSAHDDGTATIAAMNAGAHVCVRGTNPALISAYLQSIARRRGLIPEGTR